MDQLSKFKSIPNLDVCNQFLTNLDNTDLSFKIHLRGNFT